jgi:hypothetical protein
MPERKGTPVKSICKDEFINDFEKRAMGIITLNFSRKHTTSEAMRPGARRVWTFSEGGLLPRENVATAASESSSHHASDIELSVHDEEGRTTTVKRSGSGKRQAPSSPVAAGPLSMPKKRPNPLDISNAEGVDDLNEEEFNLCSNLRILPAVYFHAKHTLIDNGRTRGFYKKSAAQKMLRIDVNKTGKLYDYFYSKGWLPQSADYQP